MLSPVHFLSHRVLRMFLCDLQVYNLGTGKGYSVVEMAKAFEKASGKQVRSCQVSYRICFDSWIKKEEQQTHNLTVEMYV